MSRYGSSAEHRPVTYWRGYPIYAAHFVVIVMVASMLATVAVQTAGGGVILGRLTFDSSQVWRGEAWRALTYGFVNPASLSFALDMAMIIWFGREVEKVIGHRAFLFFYAILYLLSPVLLTVLGPWLSSGLAGEMGALAIFVAFATYFPDTPMIFNVLAKWMAVIFVGIFALVDLSNHAWAALFALLATCGFAYFYVRVQQGRINLPSIRLPRRGPKLRVLPDLPAKSPKSRKDAAVAADVDALLDKIAKSGLSSLTASERARLEKRREDLLGNPPKP
ncbi:MAG: hypothetical protein JWM32_1123 [Verrucomicrobia bacterium]|nr:hypothetical protein [Verrucomicrobiota bacterium]